MKLVVWYVPASRFPRHDPPSGGQFGLVIVDPDTVAAVVVTTCDTDTVVAVVVTGGGDAEVDGVPPLELLAHPVITVASDTSVMSVARGDIACPFPSCA